MYFCRSRCASLTCRLREVYIKRWEDLVAVGLHCLQGPAASRRHFRDSFWMAHRLVCDTARPSGRSHNSGLPGRLSQPTRSLPRPHGMSHTTSPAAGILASAFENRNRGFGVVQREPQAGLDQIRVGGRGWMAHYWICGLSHKN